MDETAAPATPGAQTLERLLRAVANGFGVPPDVTVTPDESGGLIGTLTAPEAGAVVGRGGEVIDAIQYLAAQAVSRAEGGGRRRVMVDAGDYRRTRAQMLEELAVRAAEEAVEYGEEIELDPMTPHDRRIVHLALKDRTDVTTRSEGDEPRRRIIVEPAE
ncbi:MAG TPA: R3H domain-containing nucleic acid-binding protein [Miltoncostaeaceae bacterium]|nr:R3H domain-containing nucleic acid-binding protein [Miltoncostaeaceae bacterium]